MTKYHGTRAFFPFFSPRLTEQNKKPINAQKIFHRRLKKGGQMDTSILLAYVVSVMLLVATPGPVVALVMNTSATHGAKDAFLTALGTNGASLLLILLSALIISGVMAVNQELISWLSVAGCLFISYIAISSLKALFTRHGKETVPAFVPNTPKATPGSLKSLTKGFLVAISNPKDITFFVAFFPQFISITGTFTNSIVTLIALWIAIDLSVLCAYIHITQSRIAKDYHRLISFLSSIALLSISLAGIFYALFYRD